MNFIRIAPTIVGCLLTVLLSAQSSTQHVQQTWMSYLNQTRLSNRWGIWTDVHLRTQDDWVNEVGIFLARVGGTYYLNDKTKLTAGYAFVDQLPNGPVTVSVPEHRPWQQVQWHTQSKRFRMMQYVRLEERFKRNLASNSELADDYQFNWRARHSLMMQFPLAKKAFQPGTLSFAVNNEVMVNFGKNITYNYFDQNRFFVGFHWHTNTHDMLQFGYLNVFQQMPAGNRYRVTQALRVFYFQNLDWRKSQRKPEAAR